MSVPADLDRRFHEAAEREGLVDVAYDLADSPVGALLVAVTDRGVCRIAYRPEEALDELAGGLRHPGAADSAAGRTDPSGARRVLRGSAARSSTSSPTSRPCPHSSGSCWTSWRESRSAS